MKFKMTTLILAILCSLVQYLSDIEDHLGSTIPVVDTSFEVPVDDYDGKITYGQRRKGSGFQYSGHVEEMAPVVARLTELEKEAQCSFLRIKSSNKWFM